MNLFTHNSKNSSVMKLALRIAFFGLSLFIVLEFFFRFIVISDSRPAYYQDPETRLLFFDAAFGSRGVHRFGNPPALGGRWVINEAGWASPFEYRDSIERTSDLIALYGDSYVVSLNTDYIHHLDVLIEESLVGDYEVYSFAMGGMMLMQYVKLIEYAEEVYNPSVHIIFANAGDIRTSITNYGRYMLYYQLTLEDSEFVESIPTLYQESPLRIILRRSALVRYLRQNRGISPLGGGRGIADPNANKTDDLFEDVTFEEDSILKLAGLQMFGMIRSKVGDDLVIFVGDGPRSRIYAGEESVPFPDCVIIQNLCDSLQGFEYIDLLPVYQEAYGIDSTKFNSDNNTHWNEHGNEVVAAAVIAAIRNHGLLNAPKFPVNF